MPPSEPATHWWTGQDLSKEPRAERGNESLRNGVYDVQVASIVVRTSMPDGREPRVPPPGLTRPTLCRGVMHNRRQEDICAARLAQNSIKL